MEYQQKTNKCDFYFVFKISFTSQIPESEAEPSTQLKSSCFLSSSYENNFLILKIININALYIKHDKYDWWKKYYQFLLNIYMLHIYVALFKKNFYNKIPTLYLLLADRCILRLKQTKSNFRQTLMTTQLTCLSIYNVQSSLG